MSARSRTLSSAAISRARRSRPMDCRTPGSGRPPRQRRGARGRMKSSANAVDGHRDSAWPPRRGLARCLLWRLSRRVEGHGDDAASRWSSPPRRKASRRTWPNTSTPSTCSIAASWAIRRRLEEWRQGLEAAPSAPGRCRKRENATEPRPGSTSWRQGGRRERSRRESGGYGEVIGSCATCHGMHGRVWGPGVPKTE